MRVFVPAALVLITVASLAQNNRKAKTSNVRAGVKTPGVQIPFANLKSEAEIPLPTAPATILVDQTVWIGRKDGDSLLRVDPKTNKLLDPASGVKGSCLGLTNAFGSLWAPGCRDQTLNRLDLKTGSLTKSIATGTGSAAKGLVGTSDSLWMFTDDKTTLSRIDPVENRVVAELRLPSGCRNLFVNDSILWVTCEKENKLLRIDPKTNLVSHRIDTPEQPGPIVFGENSIWVLCRAEGKLARIDPKLYEAKPPEPPQGGRGGGPGPAAPPPPPDPKLAKVGGTIDLNIPNSDGDLAFGEGSIWVTSVGFPLTRIDPQTEKVVQQFWGEGGGMVRVGLGSVWLASKEKLLRFDPKRIAATLAE
jgi:streptogramin lyase